jgi:acyl carrier protein
MELQNFIENLKEQFDDVPESFGAETRFRELDEWSSLTSLSIIAMVDDEYNIVIKTDDIKSVDTIEELFNLVKSKA